MYLSGEPEEKSDHEGEWTTDQRPTGGFYGQTGIISSEHDDRRGGSAMTMYTEDFEDSETGGSQTSFHLSFTRSNSVENENIKQNANDESSVSTHSQRSSVSTERPVKSSRCPVKTKSRRMKTKIEVTENVERKIIISQEDYNISADQVPRFERSSSVASKELKEESEGSYTDDFHSAGSELENSASDAASVDSIDAGQHEMLDLPPAANNLSYTY